MEDDYKNEYEKLWDEWLPRIKEYSNSRIELLKLNLVEGCAKAIASLTSSLVLFVTFFAFFVFASFAVALFIGKMLGDYYLGFALMAGIYLLLFIITLLVRKKLIERPILNQMIKKLLEEQSHEE